MKRQIAMFIARSVVVSAGVAVLAGSAVAGPSQPAATRAVPQRIVPGLEEPLVATRPTTADEDAALDTALAMFRVAAALAPSDVALHLSPLVHFVSTHPRSGWRVAVLGNLGFAYDRAGYVSRALDSWRTAWQEGRAATDARAAALVDKIVGALARTHARLGHADELDRLLREIANRPLRGPATEAITSALEDAQRMRDEPGAASGDGPTALKNLLFARGAAAEAAAFLDGQRAGRHGFSLAQLAGLADRAGLRHRLVHREPDQAVPVPSLVHWSVRHFAAVVGERDGGYVLADPTLGAGTDERWVCRDALDREASGYFLVPADGPQDPAWRAVPPAEAERVRGTGFTAIRLDGAITPDDPMIYPRGTPTHPPTAAGESEPSVGTGTGVAVYNAHTMLASLNLQITQSGYTSLKGPPVHVRLIYNQRDAHQPATFGFFHVGPKWTLNVRSYIEDNPAIAGLGVVRHVPGGGAVHYPTSGGPYSAATGAFAPEPRTRAVLVRIPATGPVTAYELRMPDGGKQVFARLDTATTAPRRVFLTQIVDPAGNALTLHYDDRLRLRWLGDAAGRTTRFAYTAPDDALRVTRITDPFGRSSTLHYLPGGELASSTDTTGATSSFSHDAAGLIDSMTTAYGTTSFRHGLDPIVHARFLEIADPMGFTERIEAFRSEPEHTFYWDKHALPLARATPGVAIDYADTRRILWRADTPAPSPASSETSGQAIRYSYNAAGQIVSATDAQHKVTSYAYDDLGSLTAVIDPSGTTVLALAYDAYDRVATTTDATGYVLRYAYDDLDRLTRTTYPDDTFEQYVYDRLDLVSVIDRRRQVTSYAYDAGRRRTSVTDPLGRATRFDYYDNGVLKALTEPGGNVVTWGVDLQSRPIRQEPTVRPPAALLAGTMWSSTAIGSAHAAVQPAIPRCFDRTRGIVAVAMLALLTALSTLALRAKLRKMHVARDARAQRSSTMVSS